MESTVDRNSSNGMDVDMGMMALPTTATGTGSDTAGSGKYGEVAPTYKKTIYLSGQSLKKDDVALSDAFGQGPCVCPCTCVSLNDQRATYLIDRQCEHPVSV